MPAVAPEQNRPGRSVIKLSLGITLAAVVAIVAVLLLSGASAEAATCSLTTTAPVTNWSDTTKWATCGGSYPGANAGDTATVAIGGGFTLNVDVAVPNPVIVNFTNSFSVAIPSGSSLVLEASSSATSSNTFTISGGNLGVNGGVSLPSWQAPITMNSGTFTIGPGAGLTFAAGSVYTMNGGTLQGGGTLTIPSGHTGSLTGASGAMVISNATLDDFGTVTLSSATNPLSINSGGHLKVESGGAFTLSGGAAINTDNVGSPAIDILAGGGMSQTASTNTVNVAVNNGGTISLAVSGTTLALLGGGTHTGAFGIAAGGGGITFAGSHTFNNGWSWGGPAGTNFRVSGGTSTFNNTSPVVIPTLIQDSTSTIAGPGSLQISGGFTWNGGTQSGGSTIVVSPANVTATSASITLDAGRTMQIGSGSTFTFAPAVGSVLSIDNSANLNIAGGTFTLAGDNNIQTNDPTNSKINLSLAGTLKKTAGTLTAIAAGITSTGGSTITPQAGTIAFGGGGSIDTTTLNLGTAGTTLEFKSGTFALNTTSTSVSGSTTSTLHLTNNAVMNLTTTAALAVPVTFTQDGLSTLTGPGSINLNSAIYNFNGGTMDGLNALPAPSLTTTSFGGSTININGNSASTITNGFHIVNSFGTVNFNPTSNALAVNSSAQILNSATFNLQNGNGLGITSDANGSVLFSNSGTVSKTNAAGPPLSIDVPFNNNATVNANGGELRFRGGGSSGNPSTFNVAANLGFDCFTACTSNGGTSYTLGPGTNLAGTGQVTLYNGTLAITTSLSTGVNYFQGSTNAGTLSVNAPNSFTVTGNGSFVGGTMTGSGVAKFTGNLSIGSGFSPQIDSGLTLEIAGTGNYLVNSPQSFAILSGARVVVDNGATLNVSGTGSVSGDGSFGSGIQNSGIVQKAGATTTQINCDYTQSNLPGSSTSVTVGTLALAGNGGGNISNGPFNVSTGATLAWNGGSYGLSPGASLNGPGTYRLTNGAFLNVNTPINLTNLTFQEDGAATNMNATQGVTIGAGATFKWLGGTIFGGSTTLSGGSLLIDTSANGVTLNGGTVLNINSGTAQWSGTNALTMDQSSIINVNNGGNFNVQAAANIDAIGVTGGTGRRRIRPQGASPDLINVFAGGVFQKSLNSGTTIVAADLTNQGTVAVSAGLLALSGGGTVTHSGTFSTAGGTTLDFSAGTHTFSAGAAFTGGGTVELHNATFDLTPASISVPIFDFVAGTLQGSGNVSTTSQFIWSGGTMTGSGSAVVQSGTASFDGSTGPMALQRPLTINAGATLTYGAANAMTLTYPGASITNNGTFTIAAGSQPIALSGTPPAGTYLFMNGTGATLNGNGTIGVPVSNDGNLNPGTSPGSITINGAFAQTANGTLNLDLNGPSTPGTTYDLLTVNGPVTLAGTLNTITGYTPSNGDTFTPLTFTSQSGDFTTNNLAFPGGTYSKSYTSTAMQLAAVVQVDLGESISPVATANAGSTVTYTVTTTSNGPSAAATHTVNITVTNATISAASGAGYACTVTSATTATCTSSTPLAPTTSASLAVTTVAPAQPGTMSISSAVTTVNDINAANNSASQTTTVTALADVSVTKTAPPNFFVGGTATFTITVANSGPSDAQNVVLNDPTPVPLTLVSVTSSTSCTSLSPCNIGTLAAGSSITFSATYSAPSNASGSVSNSASVTSTTPESNLLNNTASASVSFSQKADVVVTKVGPTSATPGNQVTFTITVTNNGPSDAQSVSLDDPTPTRFSLVSVTGACSAFPCAMGTLTAGASKTLQAKYTVLPGPAATVTNTATETSTTPDPNSANNSGVAMLSTGCPASAPANTSPANGLTNAPLNGTFGWNDVGAASYTVYLDVQGPNACSKFFGSTTATSMPYVGLQPGVTYQWRVEASSPGCPAKSTACMTFTTTSTCPSAPPVLIAPINATATNTATFSWTAVGGAKDYLLFVNNQQIAKVTSTTFGPTPVPNGPTSWYVVAELDPPCTSLTSQAGTFNGCSLSGTTIPSIVGQADSGQAYDLTWESVAGASRYEVDEADNADFANATTKSTQQTKLRFQHPVTTPTAFYYRVRAFFDCAGGFGANSVTVRVVLSPVTAPANPNVSAPAGNTTLIPIVVHIPGFPDGTFPFTASLDPKNPWLKSVTPSSGSLPPEGVDLTVLADPTGLKNGTHTGTVLLSVTTSSSVGNRAANGTTPVSAPVSVSLVTPVTPKPAGTPPANALIIPSTGHLDGVNSRWASDVRILNTSSQQLHYQLTFTPDDTHQSVKQTVITVDANDTTALDDVVKTWYGVGSLGESSNGSLEIRPLDNPSKSADDVSVSFVTVASSRTYNSASNASTASYGEFIPAIPFASFVGKGATVLGLQQIAQSDAMRTNLGVMEASGQPVSILVSVFDSAGKKLLDVPMTLSGGQHAQLNGFLSQNKISLPDGRIEVQVTGGEGKIAAYASVIDNKSGDPVLISGTPLRQSSFDTFVLPGVADLNTPVAAWRTDMRIFNPTTSPQTANVTFYPFTGQGSPKTITMTINGGEVKRLDNTLSSVFGVTNNGGTIHVTTAAPTPLVVTGRTYDVTSNGTYGQLANAITPADAIGQGDRPLQILQAEDSVRQRTNLGLFEVTGKPATVEVTLFVPDSKIAPSTQIPLPANGFVQIPVIQSFGLSNVYNARISMRVVGGDGRISAYGSVIDQLTQDPTLIPAQR